MFSQLLYKIAKICFAKVNQKWIGGLNNDIYAEILNNHELYGIQIDINQHFTNDNVYDYFAKQIKNEKTKEQINNKLSQIKTKIKDWLQEVQSNFKNVAGIEFNSLIVNKICTTFANNNAFNIFTVEGRQQIEEIFNEYLKYYEYFDKQQLKQLRDFNFEKLDQFTEISRKYSNIRSKIEDITKGSVQKYTAGNYIIAQYQCIGGSEQWKSFAKATKGSGWCVTSAPSYWNSYGTPYFLIVRKDTGQIFSLVNFNDSSFLGSQNYMFGGGIPKLEKNLADELIRLMKIYYKRYEKEGIIIHKGSCFKSLLQYFDINDLLNLLDKKLITADVIQPRIIKLMQSDNANVSDKLLEIAEKFKNIDLISYISTYEKFDKLVKQNDQVHLTKKQVVKIMFNAFLGGKNKENLFKEIIKYQDDGTGQFKQTKDVNRELLFQRNTNGKLLTDVITKKAQIELLRKLDENIITEDVVVKIVKNQCDPTSNSTDIPVLEEILPDLDKILINTDKSRSLLTTIMTLRKNGVITFFAQRTTMNFNQKMDTGEFPFLFAVKNKYDTIIKVLNQNNKIDFDNIADNDKQDFMSQLLFTKDQDLILSLNTKFDFKQQMTNGDYPILYALKNNLDRLYESLESQEYIQEIINDKGKSIQLLYSLMKSKNLDRIMWFLNNTSLNFNQVMYENMTPLFYAIKQGRDDILQKFIESDKIDKDITANGRDLISWAAETGNGILLELVKNVKNINHVYQYGKFKQNTVLTYAIISNNKPIFDAVLQNENIDVTVLCAIGLCVIYDRQYFFDKILSKLPNDETTYNQKIQSDQNLKYSGNSPVVVAIKEGIKNNFKYLIKFDNKINIMDKRLGQTLKEAIDNNIPYDIFIKTFGKKKIKAQQILLDFIDNKIKTVTDTNAKDNLKKIKNYILPQTSKSKNIQDALYENVIADNKNNFKEILNNNVGSIDLTKPIKGQRGKNIFQLIMYVDLYLDYIKLLIEYLKNYDKKQLRTILENNDRQLLNKTYSKVNAYFVGVYNQFDNQNKVKKASKNQRIAKFLNNYLK